MRLAEPYAPPKGTFGLPEGMVPPTPEQLTSGRWVPAGSGSNEPGWPDEPYAQFVSSGSWSGSDGCNGQGGSWSLDSQTGEWLASAGPQTLIGCNNVDIAGLAHRERELVACIARFHRRSLPEIGHALMAGLDLGERRVVRKLATLLRVADSLDRSHHQPVERLQVKRTRKTVTLKLRASAPADLEMWDVARESAVFRQVFGRKPCPRTAP